MGITVCIIINPRIFRSESINLKRNCNLLTEPHEIEELFESVSHHVTHRTRPVKNKDQTVILTIRKCGYFLEQILIVLVGVEFGAVQNTGASSGGTSVRVSSFLTLKLFHQVVDFFLCRTFELCELLVNFAKDFFGSIFQLFNPRTPVFFTLIMNLRVGDDHLLQVNLW